MIGNPLPYGASPNISAASISRHPQDSTGFQRAEYSSEVPAAVELWLLRCTSKSTINACEKERAALGRGRTNRCPEFAGVWNSTGSRGAPSHRCPALRSRGRGIVAGGPRRWHHLVSSIANTGVDNRGEFSSLITSFSQGAFKPRLRGILVESIDLRSSSKLDFLTEAFKFFLNGAQDPETGYWGGVVSRRW